MEEDRVRVRLKLGALCLRITYLFLCIHSPDSVTAPKNGTDDVTILQRCLTQKLTSFTSHIVFFSIKYITDIQPAHHENGRNSVHRLSYAFRLGPPCCQHQLAAAGIFWG